MKSFILAFILSAASCAPLPPRPLTSLEPHSSISDDDAKAVAQLAAIVLSIRHPERTFEAVHATGISMRPGLPNGAWVVRESVLSFDELGLGDFALRNDPIQIVGHRIYSATPNGWVLKPDNRATPDRDILTKDNLGGRVIITIFPSRPIEAVKTP